MKLPEVSAALVLCLLLTATTMTLGQGEVDDEDIARQFGGGEPPPEPERDEWDTEEPQYDVPAWHMPEGKVQTLEFGGGDMNDADKWSDHMPMELKCDGCRAIAYAIKEKLKKYQKRYRDRHIFSEIDIVDMMDEVCSNKKGELDGYGVKEIMGKRRLSGPGLETKEVPGVSHGGGKWGFRLQQMCTEYVNEIGEYTIYKRFLKHKSMENVLCRNKRSELGWICPKMKKRRRKKKQPAPEQEEGQGADSEDLPADNKEATPQDSTSDVEQASQDSEQEKQHDADNHGEDKRTGDDDQRTKEKETESGKDSDNPKSEKDKTFDSEKSPPEKVATKVETNAAKADAKNHDEDSQKQEDGGGSTTNNEGVDKAKDGSGDADKDVKKNEGGADRKAKPDGVVEKPDSKSSKEGSNEGSPGDATDKTGSQPKEEKKKNSKEEL